MSDSEDIEKRTEAEIYNLLYCPPPPSHIFGVLYGPVERILEVNCDIFCDSCGPGM